MTRLFFDKTVTPNKSMLVDALGDSYRFWAEIKKNLEEQYGNLTEEWKFYSENSGWTLKVLLKKRNLFFFSPSDKYFRIAFVFGDKAVKVIERSELPEQILQEVKKAKRYVEGRGLRIEVKKQKDVKNILALVEIKVYN